MDKITPRWEWRSFGRQFGKADAFFAALTPEGVQESDEIYLLSGAGDTVTGKNVKIRDALMDIKMLREVNAVGLEQWAPVMKASFPLPAVELTRVFESLQLPVPAPIRESYTLEAFLDACVETGGVIRRVNVHKRRVRYTINGCTAECSDVVANDKTTRTIAIESTDAEAVINAVRQLGLAGYTNTSYPRGLQALIDDEPERYAVIDAGTNSIKFHIAERNHGENPAAGYWRTVIDRADITRLGEGLTENGTIIPAALERTVDAIASMVAEAKQHGVRAIVAVGTAGLRIAANGNAVVDAIEKRAGVSIEVISGEEESRLAYLAAKSGLGLKTGSLVVFDTGGGSSQFTFGHDASVDERFSVDVGAVRYTERFQLDKTVSREILQEAITAISADLARIDGHSIPDKLVGMGGAVTNIAAVKHGLATYDPALIQGTVLDSVEIDRQIDLYCSLDADGRRTVVGLQPKRAEVILAGACIVRAVMQKLGKYSLAVTSRITSRARHCGLKDYDNNKRFYI